MRTKLVITDIIKRALVHTVTDMGGLTEEQRKQLKAAVKAGWLSKGKGGPFPNLKTVYAHPGFDFARDREARVAEMMRWHMVDKARGVDKFFPVVRYQ